MDDRMFKSKFCGSIQEVILPDFLDDGDDTVTTTVTKSRRVSFGTNFVKEFVVGSAVSAQCVSEYEQAFSSSDSSNANSSHSAVESGLLSQNTFVMDDIHKSNLEPEECQIKRPKISSTICFSVDSPTADMEFTEGCISLAKSILDKKNKEMTVIIQAKPKESKEEIKINKDDETKYFEGSQFDMSMTKCFKSKENKKEEKRFESDKTRIFNKFDDEMSITRCDKIFKIRQSNIPNEDVSDDMSEDEDNCKENVMPLDLIMRHLDKDNSDLEKSLFNPEKLLTDVLNKNSLDVSSESEKLNLNESMDITRDLQQVIFKIPQPIPSVHEMTSEKINEVDMSLDSKIDDVFVDAKNDEMSASTKNVEMSLDVKNDEVVASVTRYEEDMILDSKYDDVLNISSQSDKGNEGTRCVNQNNEEIPETNSGEITSEEERQEETVSAKTNNEEDMHVETNNNTQSPRIERCGSPDAKTEDGAITETNKEIPAVSLQSPERKVETEPVHAMLENTAVESRIEEVAPVEFQSLNKEATETLHTRNEFASATSKDIEDMSIEIRNEAEFVGVKIAEDSSTFLKNIEAGNTKLDEDFSEDNDQLMSMDINNDKDVTTENKELSLNSTKEQSISLDNNNCMSEDINEVMSIDSKADEADSINTENLCAVTKNADEIFVNDNVDVNDDVEDLSKHSKNNEDNKLPLNCSADEFDGQITGEASLSKIDISITDLMQADDSLEESVISKTSLPTAGKDIVQENQMDTNTAGQPSLVDTKVVQNLKDQASETGCIWVLRDFKYPQNQNPGFLLFDFEFLESTITIEFSLKSSEEDTLDSCSSLSGKEIRLNEDKQFKVPEYTLVKEFGFEKLKKIFEKEVKGVKIIRHVPYFLDQMNLFAVKNNSCLRQVYNILTSYPGSNLKGSTLSFRLYSFPIFFSCNISIDLADMLRLSSSCLSFTHDFGTFNKNKIIDIFQECLQCDNSLCEFIIRSTKYLIDLERETGYVSKRQHIRLLPPELHS